MKKLIFWLSPQNENEDCYNIFEKTKNEAINKIIVNNSYVIGQHTSLYKMQIEYNSIFELAEFLTGDCGGRRQYVGYELESYTGNKFHKLIAAAILRNIKKRGDDAR